MSACSLCGLSTSSRFGVCTRSTCRGAYFNARGQEYYARNRDAVLAASARRYAADPSMKRATQQAKYEWLRFLKIGKSCADCGLECTEANYPAFQWDHRPGEVKSFGIARAGFARSKQEVLNEIAKCDLRCANCHAIITHQRQRGTCVR